MASGSQEVPANEPVYPLGGISSLAMVIALSLSVFSSSTQ